MAALLYLLQAAVTFVVIAFLLRAIMPLVRADFRNPLGQAVLRFTDPVIRPLRKVLGPVGRIDVASFVAVYAAQYAGTTLLRLVAGGGFAPGRTALAAALAVFEAADLRGIVGRAATAAARRSAELAAQSGER